MIFLEGDRKAADKAELGALKWCVLEASAEEVLMLRGDGTGCGVFFMGPESGENYRRAAACRRAGAEVYCQSEFAPDRSREGLTLFDRWDCCARLYWQENPLEEKERKVVLLGCGRYGTALLERALQINVYGPQRQVTYHVFGDSTAFRRTHYRLGSAVWVNEAADGRDGVVFHETGWEVEHELLEEADRVILCEDQDGENLEHLQQIRRFFCVRGKLHLRLSEALEEYVTFGDDARILTPALVMRRQLSRVAEEMHEIYRRSSGGNAPAWEELSDFLRRSNIAAADHLLVKIRLLLHNDTIREITAENCREAFAVFEKNHGANACLYREIEHERWVRFYALHNWQYAPVRDNDRRLHPSLRPFAELSETEQAKDDYAWQLLGAVAQWLEQEGGR